MGTFTETPLGDLVLETDTAEDGNVLLMYFATPAYREAAVTP